MPGTLAPVGPRGERGGACPRQIRSEFKLNSKVTGTSCRSPADLQSPTWRQLGHLSSQRCHREVSACTLTHPRDVLAVHREILERHDEIIQVILA